MGLEFDKNKPETWVTAALHALPDFDVAKYQARIDEIFGLSDTGLAIVRLVWAPDIKKCYSKFYTSWVNLAGAGSELRARYKYSTLSIPGTPDIIDIPPPRWIIEQFEHPGQANASYEAARFTKDGRELRPPPPPDGDYSHLFTIASHYSKCCKQAKKDKVVCWGYYRLPAERDLERLRKAKADRDADRFIDITKPLTAIDKAHIGIDVESRLAQEKFMTEQHVKEFVDENALELLELFTGRKFSEKTKKFSIPKHLTKKENGLFLP